MSNACTLIELDKTREQWRRAYNPISTREVATWLQDLRDALRSIPYIRVVKCTDGGLLNMIDIRTVQNIEGLHPDMVKADLERVWSNDVAKGLRATHCFRETANGIVLYYVALNAMNFYVTGVVHVSRKE